MSILYIVSTPIGNLKDITLRALEVLKVVDFILAEDTRKTGLLLAKYGIKGQLLSFHEYTEEKKMGQVISLLKEGADVALVSDAGTPTLSDPGFKLVREAAEAGFKVVPVPGPSAILAALVSSGLPTDNFLFLGYLPKKEGKINKTFDFIEQVTASHPTTIIFFESPYRLEKTLKALAEKFPERELVICRELTKIHEEFIRGKVKDLIGQNITTKGEFTLLLR